MFLSTGQRFVTAAIFSLLYTLGPNVGRSQEKTAPGARPQAAAGNKRKADQVAAAAVMQSVAKAFEARDAKQLAAHWTAEGEYQNAQGVDVHGREELEKIFAALFAKTPEVTAQIRAETLRFLSADIAIEEGRVTVQRGPTEPTTEADYTALLVRGGGQWSLVQLTETAVDEPSIEDLSWLIGEWKTESGKEANLLVTFAWDANKKFIHVRFTRNEKELAVSGTQVLGIDPATGEIRSWIFEADGGIGEADWSRDGDHWTLDVHATLADGSSLKETNIYRRINDELMTWQSIDRVLDEAELPDLPPVKVTRVNTQK
jgi:uncharacterized protein (TIGR02246 family)